ncbi:ras and Rab interactor-like protein isoform X2 [Vulpes vulpes]|uniref:Ras and Rab interactor-like protein isoform X2 n=1 Tax=Vulpes vulpes TaxID=9627 RepID=A0ABM4ZZQ9_VULVU
MPHQCREVNGVGETPVGVLGTPEPLLRLWRTSGVWQVPELDTQDAEALLELWPPGSFLVTGYDPSQVLVLRTGASRGEVRTYQIQKLPGGVSLKYSNLCMPDLPHLLAFLSASRDVLPRTLLLPPPTLRPGDQHAGPLQIGGVQLSMSERVLSVVNKLYVETHRGWRTEQMRPETPPETAERHRSAPRNPAPHRVSWVEGPLSPEVHHAGPALASLVEETEKEDKDENEDENEDDFRDEENEPEDVLTHHIQALARARGSYVGRQFQGLRARLTSNARGPHRPGDPATELLQDVRHLLTDLQDHLSKDPDVRAVFGSLGPGTPRKDDGLGNKEDWEGIYGHSLNPLGFSFATSWRYVCVRSQLLSLRLCAPLACPLAHLCLRIGAPVPLTLLISHVRAPPSTRVLTHVYTCGWPEAGRGSAEGGGARSSRRPFAQPPQPVAGAAVEAALCRAVLAPLKPALWTRLRTLRAGELRRLRQRQVALRAGAGPPGAQGAGLAGQGPAPALRSRIHARLAHLHAACAPRRKVALLLAVCSDVYAGLARGENQEPLGADAFLPALTEELIWSPHIGETQLDVEFLMELLDPDELRGEAGYYLTTWFGALHHIAHYQPDAGRAPQGLSSEARASLRQWHSRRTLHRQDRQSHDGAQVSLSFEEPWVRDPVPRDQ